MHKFYACFADLVPQFPSYERIPEYYQAKLFERYFQFPRLFIANCLLRLAESIFLEGRIVCFQGSGD